MFTLPIPRRVRTWLIRIKGVARLEHNPTVDASELWNRTATPETLATLAGMALKLASVPDCPYHKQHTKCRYETGNVPNCTECRLQWAFAQGQRNEGTKQGY